MPERRLDAPSACSRGPTRLDHFIVGPLEDDETGFVDVEFAKIGLRF